jgi:hypothetical protein
MEGEFVYPLAKINQELISEPRFDVPLLVSETGDVETKDYHKN